MSIKAIHTIKGKLGLSDTEYRALLFRCGGVMSAKDLSPEGDKAVMAALRTMERGTTATREKSRAEAKIWALWYDIKPYLPETERTVPYLLGIVSRVIGRKVQSTGNFLRFTARENYKIIEALKARLRQEEWTFSQKTGVPF